MCIITYTHTVWTNEHQPAPNVNHPYVMTHIRSTKFRLKQSVIINPHSKYETKIRISYTSLQPHSALSTTSGGFGARVFFLYPRQNLTSSWSTIGNRCMSVCVRTRYGEVRETDRGLLWYVLNLWLADWRRSRAWYNCCFKSVSGIKWRL